MTKLKGSVFPRDNGTFTAVTEPRWNADKGKKVRTSLGTFPTKGEAEERQLEYNLGLYKSSFTRPAEDLLTTTVDDFLTDWVDRLGKEHDSGLIQRGTLIDYRRVVRLHIRPYLGHLRVDEITPAIMREWVLQMAHRSVGERTIQKATRALHRAFGDTDLPTNPAKLPRRTRPKVRTKRKQHPTSDEITAFLRHVQGCDARYGADFAPMWRLAATTGMRRGELAGLAWEDIDWDNRTVTIDRTIQHDGSSLYVKGPKSDNGYRTIGVDAATLRLLRVHRTSMAEERMSAGPEYQHEPLGYDWVFRHDDLGSPLPPQRITVSFKREWKHAGLRDGPSPHGLRHSHGSELILAGIPITQVAAHIGDHPHTLMSTYAHELDEAARRGAITEAIAAIY